MPTLEQYATHTPFTDPGRHAPLLAAAGTGPEDLHRAATGTLLHYRGEADRVTPEQLPDVDLRWVSAQLDTAQARNPVPLGAPRTDAQCLAGCCRDHTLLSVAILREHGVPARCRIGFARYFRPDFHVDHAVVERWDGDRWVRSDSELAQEGFDFDVHDLPAGFGAPFETAAEVWLAARAGKVDPARYGVDPTMPELTGMPFLLGEVFLELAHRELDEILLWDVWGPGIPPFALPAGASPDPMPHDDAPALADEIATLLVAADAGDAAADAELDARWATDARLRPSANRVVTLSPLGRIGDADLTARTTTWRT
ncbi:transglutaminase-like domain-containing protein [Cellulomonas alba]|uniref:Transglutaminase-like domain-containing protein n=1 Tax=Cellulomonas alba TaxID=3053467 RepID=A0ABT7SHE9_9CELL|nr:transglutaminase-like domain-containing protein [Cellulomonas alba]MDM7855611.1 transglutaminase-like domain-containing protein [Cellulomonas alba]